MADGAGDKRLGWIGAGGRMGSALASRLLAAGCSVAVYNRTREKCAPLVELGATVADSPAGLAGCDVVFVSVSGDADFRQVLLGAGGLLADGDVTTSLVVDISTVSTNISAEVRSALEQRGVELLASPVSGNPKVVRAGSATFVASGPEAAFRSAEPYLDLLGAGATYVGEGERARLVKICHNLLLGIVSQTLAEVLVLGERGGVRRADMLAFINDSVMGSVFSRYKTPALVKLDFTPTFTPELLLKDFNIGVDAARELGVPMPITAATRELVQNLIGHGFGGQDFATLLSQQANAADLELEPESVDVTDGLTTPTTPQPV
jgi:3-hydroxyisobutyrate dehydrogenase-like beta-hydroxyacid dehydrogenase